MEKHQLETMLCNEQISSKFSIQSHPKRRQIADCLNKLTDDEGLSDDIFALTMSLFDRFMSKTDAKIRKDRLLKLITLSCYNLAKKLRTNSIFNKENERISSIFSEENYSDEEIFNTELLISDTLDWDLTSIVPQDYIPLLLNSFVSSENRTKISLHVHILLSLVISEINTLSIRPSLLACACLKSAMNGLALNFSCSFEKVLHCNRIELHQTESFIEQIYKSYVKMFQPSLTRRCLVPIDTNPHQRTKVK